MKLTANQIKDIAWGAVYASEEDGAVRLHRFTARQEEFYRSTNADFYRKSQTPAGIKLYFVTDSRNLGLKVRISAGTTRSYYSVDVFVNGELAANIDNFSHLKLPENYSKVPFCLDGGGGAFSIGEGRKTVCIYMPWSVCADIEELSLDDGTYIEPVIPQRRILVYGDSITHGYDALRPSNRYAARLCDAIGAEEINKAIGGEMFSPELGGLPDSFTPDYITVAYGTNDWNHKKREELTADCRAFFENLRKSYPDTKIFAITPIWRSNMTESRPCGDFMTVGHSVCETVRDIGGIVCINGFDFVPHDRALFGDLSLHPSDAGFEHYFKNLYECIKPHIKE